MKSITPRYESIFERSEEVGLDPIEPHPGRSEEVGRPNWPPPRYELPPFDSHFDPKVHNKFFARWQSPLYSLQQTICSVTCPTSIYLNNSKWKTGCLNSPSTSTCTSWRCTNHWSLWKIFQLHFWMVTSPAFTFLQFKVKEGVSE